MKEQFCSYKISLKLKELGFDEPCILYYNTKNREFDMDYCNNLSVLNDMLPSNTQMLIGAPLWQQAKQWLRDTHNYHIAVYRLNDKWCGDVYDILRQCYITTNAFDGNLQDSYEEAREQVILKCIELCQNKK